MPEHETLGQDRKMETIRPRAQEKPERLESNERITNMMRELQAPGNMDVRTPVE